MNTQIISDVLREFERERKIKDAELSRKTMEIYEKIPEFQQIDKKISQYMISLSKSVMLKSASFEIAQIKQSVEKLQNDKINLLVKNNYPANFLTNTYNCILCNDSGYNKDKYCDCLYQKCKILENRSKGLGKSGEKTFENFNLDYYSKLIDERFKLSPYETAAGNFNFLKQYAETFTQNSDSLILSGANGLSKTHLAHAVAKVVSTKNYNVIFDTAMEIMEAYEFNKFQGYDEACREKIFKYENCDFLVIDGLGFEMSTTFTISALYKLINFRLENQKPILITTTFSMSKLQEKYSETLASRFKGDFDFLFFFGDDIRQKIRKLRR